MASFELEVVKNFKSLSSEVQRLATLEQPVQYNYQGDQNPVINGNFSVNQRQAVYVITAAQYTLDQWVASQVSTVAPAITVSQQTTATNQAEFAAMGELTPVNYLRWAQTSLGTAHTSSQIVNRIENSRTFQGLPVVFSYKARASVAGAQLTPELFQTGTGGGIQTGATVALTTAWQKYYFATTLPNNITATPAPDFLALRFKLQPSLVCNFDIAEVQLDRGNVAASFKYEDFDTTKKRCSRYYQKSFPYATAPADVVSAGAAIQGLPTALGGVFYLNPIYLPVPLRIVPTAMTIYNPAVAVAGTVRNFTRVNNSTTVAYNAAGSSETILDVAVTAFPVGWVATDLVSYGWAVSVEI